MLWNRRESQGAFEIVGGGGVNRSALRCPPLRIHECFTPAGDLFKVTEDRRKPSSVMSALRPYMPPRWGVFFNFGVFTIKCRS